MNIEQKIQEAKDKNLQKLYICYHRLPPTFGPIGPNGQRELIPAIPKEIGELVNLKELYIYYNQLTSIPEEIGNLVNLKYLHIYNNQLTSIPEEIGNLVNLKSLLIDNNKLTSISKEI